MNMDLAALVAVLTAQNNLLQQPRPVEEHFKPPEFDGTGSVEVFIRQFEDVAEANHWGLGAALLHLRRSLRGEARDCGAGADFAEVCIALRTRFGMTQREAATKLSQLRKEGKTSLQEHATRLKELLRTAHPTLPAVHRDEMSLTYFVSTLNHAGLQGHLLARGPQNLAEAVEQGNEYLQIRRPTLGVRQLEQSEDVEEDGSQLRAMPLQVRADSPPETRQAQSTPIQPSLAQVEEREPRSTQPSFGQPWLTQLPQPSVAPVNTREPRSTQPSFGQPWSTQLPQVSTGEPRSTQPSFGQPWLTQLPNGGGQSGGLGPVPTVPTQGQYPLPVTSVGQPVFMQQTPVQTGMMGFGMQNVTPVGANPPQAMMPGDPSMAMAMAMTQLTTMMGELQKMIMNRKEPKKLVCFHCNQEGHVKNKCPKFLAEKKNQGNSQGQQ